MFKCWFKCLPHSVRNWICIPRVRVKVDTIVSVCSPELLWRDEGWKAGEAHEVHRPAHLEFTAVTSQRPQHNDIEDVCSHTHRHAHVYIHAIYMHTYARNRRLLQQTRNEDENYGHFPWFLVKVQFFFLFREENPVSVSEQYIIQLIILFGIPNLITFLIFSISA